MKTRGRVFAACLGAWLVIVAARSEAGMDGVVAASGTKPGGGAFETGLPDRDAVLQALAALPEIRVAREFTHAERANRDQLAAGSQEWQLRSGLAQRTVAPNALDPGRRDLEWELGVEHGLRSTRKAGIDRAIGEAGVRRADNALGDAVHEAARRLLQRWSEFARNEAEAAVLQDQQHLWQQTRAAVQRRVALGDAARLDLELTEASLADAEARLADAQGRASALRAGIAVDYPALAASDAGTVCQPEPDPASLESYLERLMEDQHEVALAEAELERRLQLAERASADEHPDPTVAFRVASERAGAEHLAGVVLTVPLGGENRTAATRAALAEAEAARAQLERVRLKVRAEVAGQYARRQGLQRSWEATRQGSERHAAASARIERAYALGEIGLAELLAARRLEQEARLAESGARSDLCAASQRLQLDVHALWPLDVLAQPWSGAGAPAGAALRLR